MIEKLSTIDTSIIILSKILVDSNYFVCAHVVFCFTLAWFFDASLFTCVVQHLDEGKILDAMSLEKDVDGFHPLNMGNLAMRGGEPLFIPCTPKGCIELLIRLGVEIVGKNAVVIGRSNIVGLPTSLLLQVITYPWKMSWSLIHLHSMLLSFG